MISTILNDEDGESIRVEVMGDGVFYLCQKIDGVNSHEYGITITEKQLTLLASLTIEWGMPFPLTPETVGRS